MCRLYAKRKNLDLILKRNQAYKMYWNWPPPSSKEIKLHSLISEESE